MKHKHRVLIVEDEPSLLSGIQEILEIEGYSVLTAYNGKEALAVLREQGDYLPDVIVSDIKMPQMDGFGFLEEVRKQDRWVKIPFIFLTAFGERTDRHRGAQLGADVYLTKPFNAEDLIVAVSTRIDRSRRMGEVAAAEMTDMKRKILTILNHEFRTPLTLVVAYNELLKDFDASMTEQDIMTFLKGVNTGANRLRRLVENFITLVELDSGDCRSTYEWRRRPIIRLNDHVQEAFQQITFPEDKPRLFEHEIASDLPPFIADGTQLTIILRELMDNAAKFTPEDSHFRLRAHCVGDWIEIQVQDFGGGIPAQEHENIWLPFYQVDREKTEQQGAGAGLAIVEGLLKIHGGTRAVTSEEGQGSVFTVRLPVQPPSVPARTEG